MRSTEVPDLDTAAVLAACRERVLAVCPEHLELAAAVLERVQPPRWKLEWYLPWWLGGAFKLDRNVAGEIVVSNVLGLASIRLEDDLIDGEVDPRDRSAARSLSAVLYDEALETYRERFDQSSPFWGVLDGLMSQWRSATHANGPSSLARSSFAPEVATFEPEVATIESNLTTSALARRGAPLKISAFAVCILTDNAAMFPVLDRCLDHALTALVLYDHFCDWEADLDAGRWNAYVARLTAHPQIAAYRDRNRSNVFVAMLTGNAVEGHFAAIRNDMAEAVKLSETLELNALAAHFRDWTTRSDEQGAREESYYRHLADRAQHLLLGGVRPGAGG